MCRQWIPGSLFPLPQKPGYEAKFLSVVLFETSCLENMDYLPPTTTSFVFLAGNLRVCVNVTILSDNDFEESEEFTGHLQGFAINGMSETIVEGITLEPALTRVEIQNSDGTYVSSHR